MNIDKLLVMEEKEIVKSLTDKCQDIVDTFNCRYIEDISINML